MESFPVPPGFELKDRHDVPKGRVVYHLGHRLIVPDGVDVYLREENGDGGRSYIAQAVGMISSVTSYKGPVDAKDKAVAEKLFCDLGSRKVPA